jgi:hypothetical protein
MVRRTLNKKGDIMEFVGAWKNISDEVVRRMKDDIRRLRKKSTEELLKK